MMFNRTTQLGATYDADFLTSTEFGFKSISMDGRLRLNGAMYQMDWDDIQLDGLIPQYHYWFS